MNRRIDEAVAARAYQLWDKDRLTHIAADGAELDVRDGDLPSAQVTFPHV